ncbi:MAG TPA: anti-sigma factor [Candidatus Angelobacter sp.]|nr:anti-sigma factor [Candidatus Angelobacter sp.]
MNCKYRQKIALYADDELGPPEQQEVSGHLATCPECSAALLELLEMKKSVRLAGTRFSAPLELRRTVQEKLRVRKTPAAFWKWGLALACCLLVATLSFMVYSREQRQNTVIAGLVDQHIIALASEHAVDVVSDDRHNVKPWFQGKLPFTFNLPEVANSPFKLDGGKVVYQQQEAGAELQYEIRKHKISVFIFRSQDGSSKLVHDRGSSFTVEHWTEGGLRFYLVTDASSEDVHQLASMLQEANRL